MSKKKESMTGKEKQKGFAEAFETCKKYLGKKNYIGAYVVAFSIFEDRVRAAAAFGNETGRKPKPRGFNPLKGVVGSLKGALKEQEYQECVNEISKRNEKVHAAMWNLNEFSSEDTEKVISIARKVDNLARRLKRESSKFFL